MLFKVELVPSQNRINTIINVWNLEEGSPTKRNRLLYRDLTLYQTITRVSSLLDLFVFASTLDTDSVLSAKTAKLRATVHKKQ